MDDIERSRVAINMGDLTNTSDIVSTNDVYSTSYLSLINNKKINKYFNLKISKIIGILKIPIS
jgi:hypothetical protein